MDAKTAIAILGIPAAAIASVVAIDARAQEAAKAEAKQTVKQEMVPVQQQLEKIVQGQRRDEDFKKLTFCLDREYQDLTPAERKVKCQEESKERWVAWETEDEESVSLASEEGEG